MFIDNVEISYALSSSLYTTSSTITEEKMPYRLCVMGIIADRLKLRANIFGSAAIGPGLCDSGNVCLASYLKRNRIL